MSVQYNSYIVHLLNLLFVIMKSFASLFLIITLCLWPIQTGLAALDNSDSLDMQDHDGDETEAEADSDGDGESDAAETEASVANAAEVADAASAAGLSDSDIGEIGSINTTENANFPNDGVSVGGNIMTKDQALDAIASIATAKETQVPIDSAKTLGNYAKGSACSGCVVGKETGVQGSPEEVGRAEIEAAISKQSVSYAASVETSATIGYVTGAPNISDAISQATKNIKEVSVSVVSGRTTQIDAYREMARTGTEAGILGIGGTTNTSYSYDPTTGKFTGLQNGLSFDKIPGAAGVELAKSLPDILSKAENDSAITVDLSKGVTSVTNPKNGSITNYSNATADFVAPSLNSPVFSKELTPGAINSFTPVTGAINLFQGVPINQVSVQQRAQQLNAMNLVTVGELNPDLREKIANGEPLTADEMAEVMAVHGTLANRAAATNQTYDTFAYKDKIISSISVDKKAFGNWNTLTYEQKTNVNNFNENLMSGNFYTGKAGFTSYATTKAVSLPNATHFHAVDTTPKGWSIATDQPNAVLGGHVVGQVYTADATALEFGDRMVGQPVDTYAVVTVTPTSYDAVVSLSRDKVSSLSETSITPTRTPVDLDSYGGPHDVDQPGSMTTAADDEHGNVFEEQSGASIRTGAITVELYAQLEYAAKKNGVNVHVYSGGQPSVEDIEETGKGKRTGSTRHNHGNAADFYLTKDGQKLDMTKEEDREIMKSFLSDTVAAGATGIGADVEYMGKHNMHVGGGSTSAWGQGGLSVNAPDFVKEALADGLSRRGTVDLGDVSPRTSSSETPGSTRGGTTGSPVQTNDAGSDVGRTTGQIIGGAVGGPIGSLIGGLLGERIVRDVRLDLGNTTGNSSGGTNTINPPDDDNDQCGPGQATSSSCPGFTQNTQKSLIQKAASFAEQVVRNDSQTLMVATTNKAAPSTNQRTIVVNVTIDDQNSLVRLSREDLMEELIENSKFQSKEDINETLASINKRSIVFDDRGKVSYSDGLYSPAIENGSPIDIGDSITYSYVVKHIDKNGQTVNVTNNADALPESFATKFIKDLFISDAPFGSEDLEKVTYRLVNPKENLASDEYYDYVIYLKDGSYRSTTIPQFTSVSFMAERFKEVGYQGEVMDLLSGAEETTEQAVGQNILQKLVEGVKEVAGKFMEAIGLNDDAKLADEFTNLPGFESNVTSADIRSVFIYPNAAVECPDIPDYDKGYAYVAVLNNRGHENRVTTLTTGRCGTGDMATLVAETAKNLAEEFGIKDVTYESIKDKTFVRSEQIYYTPSIVDVDLSPAPVKPNESAVQPTPVDDQGKPVFVPNTTNTLVFEVKAVGSNGSVISDWKQTESISISSGSQLFFRWNGKDYQQCLPFFQEAGNYALTRQDTTMITGNTESEGYNLTERTGTYRIECGGQRNNEYGVDERKLEVTIQ